MAGFIGNVPAEKYTALQRQTFSSPTGTSHTLSYSVTNSDDLLLYINNVKQDPADYTASGTSLTTPTLVSGDEMYALFYGRATETVNPPDNSVGNSAMADDAIGLAELSATGTPSASTFLAGNNTWAIPSGGKILQVVSDTGNSSTVSMTSTTWTDIDTIGTITPASSSSKVLVMLNYMMYSHTGGGDTGGSGKIVRNSTTDIGYTQTLYIAATASTPAYQGNFFNMILDSPSSSSAVQYNLYQRAQYGGTIQTNYGWECVLMEVEG